jgi:hypothetical protein
MESLSFNFCREQCFFVLTKLNYNIISISPRFKHVVVYFFYVEAFQKLLLSNYQGWLCCLYILNILISVLYANQINGKI